MGKGMLLVISGPSGVGKSTVIHKMMSESFYRCYFSVSMTTRAPREGEIDGKHYFFVSEDTFLERVEQGLFLEYAKYDKHYYGTPLPPIMSCIEDGGCAILDIDIQGMRQVTKKLPECVTVFITPPSPEELERRLRDRKTESEERVLKRLEIARRECEHKDEYQYLIVNDIIERASLDLAAVVRAESLKTFRSEEG